MLVSWNWLKEYVRLDMELAELEHRLAMSGLNHEESRLADDDVVIDLEVTSNRPDCLGHIGIAREIAVLWDKPLNLPNPNPAAPASSVEQLTRVRIDCPELCPRYTARVIQGVRVGPSPNWMVQRLEALGIASVNNIVDVTNYVLMECGQPLHAFDFATIAGPEIIVRDACMGEQFVAINHHTYNLEPGMCVIADAERSVALGGVMGGADTEVSNTTRDVLVEAADFSQLSIRNTARSLNLHSPSSYRFERGVDPQGVDWASRRCCELILELAGGRLAAGVIDTVGAERPPRKPIVLRLSQLPRILGIQVPQDEVRRILESLGNEVLAANAERIEVQPPSWRRDLYREIDLIEEVARIHGYDQIPEDAMVAMVPSHRDDRDRVVCKVRHAMTAAGFDEALTASVVSEELSEAFSPWSQRPAIQTRAPMLRGADRLRRSIVPSLLTARRLNESLSNAVIELFETAKVYLPTVAELPDERGMLSLTSGQDFAFVKGLLESVVRSLNPAANLETKDYDGPLLDPDRSCWIVSGGDIVGCLGELNDAGLKRFDLRGPATVAEVRLDALESLAELVPQYVRQSPYPSVSRDLNLVVDESLTWAKLAATVTEIAGESLESLNYREIYRDESRDGPSKKRLLFSLDLRLPDRTLTGEEADVTCNLVIQACRTRHNAQLIN